MMMMMMRMMMMMMMMLMMMMMMRRRRRRMRMINHTLQMIQKSKVDHSSFGKVDHSSFGKQMSKSMRIPLILVVCDHAAQVDALKGPCFWALSSALRPEDQCSGRG